MDTMTVKDVINLSHGNIAVRFAYDGENHFMNGEKMDGKEKEQ